MSTRRYRLGMLALIALDLVLIVIPVAQYQAVLHQQGAPLLIIEPVATLLMYGPLVLAISRRERVVRNATVWGLCSGVISVAHILVENYVHLAPETTATLLWAFIVTMFLPSVAAGYRARSFLGGVWSAMISMLLTIAYGWSELLWDLPSAVARNIGSPDLARSGWTDVHAFAIVDLLQAGFSHLLIGLIIGAVLGGIGALTRRAIGREQPA